MTEVESIYLAAALAAYEAGLSVVPPREDGSKQPIEGGWARFQRKRAELSHIYAWYENGRTGVGAVMGAVSRNTALFEFDDFDTYLAFREAATAAGLGPLVERIRKGYSELTPNRGIHWLVRSSAIGRSTKLARRIKRPEEMRHEGDRFKVLIETKENGGYVILAPSSGDVHPTHGEYRQLDGSFATIAELTPDEWQELCRLARTFDECDVDEDEQPATAPHPQNGAGGRPGDVYITRTTWAELLEPQGWKEVYRHNGVIHWRRPGKDHGISATTNWHDSDLFYVFSSSTVFDAERGYNRFSAYAVLAHGGNYAAAAKELRRQGFKAEPAVPDLDDLSSRPHATEDANAPPAREPGAYDLIDIVDYMNRPRPRWQIEDVIQEETFVCVYGPPGTYKTFFVLDLVLCLAANIRFQGKRAKPGRVLYILAEGQGGFGMRVSAWQIGRGVFIPRDTVRVIDQAVPLHDIQSVSKMVDSANALDFEPSVIVFDTLAQNMVGTDENSSESMSLAVDAANKLRRRFHCTVIVVHHGRKSDGALRGHSSLLGALNTVIRLSTNDEAEARGEDRIVEVYVEKQKDGEQHHALFYLRPRTIELPAAPDDDLPTDDDEIIVEVASSSVVLDLVSDAEDRSMRAAGGREPRKPAALKGHARDYALVLWQEFGRLGCTETEWRDALVRRELLTTSTRGRWRDVRASLLQNRFIRLDRRDETDWFYPTDALERRLKRDNQIPDGT